MSVFKILTGILMISSFIVSGVFSSEDDHDHEIDPFRLTLAAFNRNVSDFDAETLQSMLDHFGERFECTQRNASEENHDCSLALCLNATQILDTLGVDSAGVVDEETFEDIAVILVSLVSDLDSNCHTDIKLSNETIQYYQNELSAKLSPNGGLTPAKLQEFLDGLPLHVEDETDHDDPDDHDDHDDHESELEHEHDHDANEDVHNERADEHGHEDEHIELYKDKCFGADVIFDDLKMSLDKTIHIDEMAHLSSLIVYYILSDSDVSRNCRDLPRKEFFNLDIFMDHGAKNGTLEKTAFEEIMEKLKIGSKHTATEHAEEDSDDSHNHRRRRSTEAPNFSTNESWSKTCYSGDQLFAVYDIDGDITMDRFTELCPALIQQVLSNACAEQHSEETEHKDRPTMAERYGYGSLATFIVCLFSVIGAIFIRQSAQTSQQKVLNLFIGLAVGTLFSDALIHLIPQAMGLHNHEDDDHAHADDEGIKVEEFVVFAIISCAGIYLFYLLELAMTVGPCMRNHGHSHHNNDSLHLELEIGDNTNGSKYIVAEKTKENGFTDNNPTKESALSDKEVKGVAPVVYLVLIGDGVHNLLDGMAIGASFSSSLTLGLSTSIAVLCHEIPHELGDFAILLQSGMPFCRALLCNFMSSLTAMIGLYIGVALSTVDTEKWIIAATAGMFLYVSLVSMMPEMLRQSRLSGWNVLWNNVGLMLGVGAMILLAVFEEKIKI